MKTYNNGPRKGMMYGGAAKRKPMMYGGMATKPRKKAQAGGKMSATQPQQNMMQNQMMPVPSMTKAMDRTPMKMGGKSPRVIKDGKEFCRERRCRSTLQTVREKARYSFWTSPSFHLP